MSKRFPLFYLFIIFLGIFVFEGAISSCASISSPSGGPRDTAVPKLDTSFPANYSINFSSKTIELIFDEYMSLKNPNQQIVVSPPLENALDIVLKGKRLYITIIDSLKPNTTYTISFGSSLTDFTEGNVNKDFKYIFSTGTFIDSLKLQGHIHNSFSGEVEKELLVNLYELPDSTVDTDSLPFKSIPSYYTYTDDKGNFEMDYLKSGKFMLLAFSDPQADFKLNGGEDKIAFYSEYISTADSINNYELNSFSPLKPLKFYGARHKEMGKIVFGFSQPVPDVKLKCLDSINEIGFFPNSTQDSVVYWFDGFRDSLQFSISGRASLEDTVTVFLREYDPPKISLKVARENLRAYDTLKLIGNYPLLNIDSSQFIVFSKDTGSVKFFNRSNPLELQVTPLSKTLNYSLYVKKGGIKSIGESENDSTLFKIKTFSGESVGNMDFKVVSDRSYHYILEIFNSQGSVMVKKQFTDSVNVSLKGYLPGKYRAQLIIDDNNDGKWTTGDFFKKRQAEKLLKYREEIEIRANWDLELKWLVKIPD